MRFKVILFILVSLCGGCAVQTKGLTTETTVIPEVKVTGSKNVTFNWTWTEAGGAGLSGLLLAGVFTLLKSKNNYSKALEACIHGVGLAGSEEYNWIATERKADLLGVSKFLEMKRNKILKSK